MVVEEQEPQGLSFWFDVSENRAVGENFEKLDETVSTLVTAAVFR